MYGQVVSWGQFGLASLVSMLFAAANPDKYTPYMGTVVTMGLQGSGKSMENLFVKGAFTEVHRVFPDAYSYAASASNLGLVLSVGVGIVLMSWKRVWETEGADGSKKLSSLVISKHRRKRKTSDKLLYESLAVHVGFIALSVGVSFGITLALNALERFLDVFQKYAVLSVIPIDPLCMLVSTLISKIFSGCSDSFLNLHSFSTLATCGLDFIVAIQIGRIHFPSQVVDSWTDFDVEFIVVIVVVFLWNSFCLAWLSRKMCPNFWFLRGLAEFGQCTGGFWMGACVHDCACVALFDYFGF